MEFKNFRLPNPTQEIEIISGDLRWDLHNFARLAAFGYHAKHSTFELEWLALDGNDPWGCAENRFNACRLCFHEVRSVRVTKDPENMASDDSFCLHGLSKVDPGAKEYRFKAKWEEGEAFNFLIQFTSGWEIEVDAASAKLIPVK